MTQTAYNSRDDLLGQTAVRYRDVPIPELEQKYRIRSLSELEKTAYETAPSRTSDEKTRRERVLDARRRLSVLCLVDGQGNRLLSDADIERLAGIDGLLTGRIFDACWEHCGFAEADSVEDLVKNFNETRDDDSPSDSPAT